jgi:hypothetical protein
MAKGGIDVAPQQTIDLLVKDRGGLQRCLFLTILSSTLLYPKLKVQPNSVLESADRVMRAPRLPQESACCYHAWATQYLLKLFACTHKYNILLL